VAGNEAMTERTAAVNALRDAHSTVVQRIAAACARVGRDPAEVTLVAVSKEVDASRLRDAVRAGIRTFGENRVQEALGKQPDVHGDGVTWHLIGPLQSNKARRAIEAFDVIETVDSVGLAERLDRIAREVRDAITGARYPVLLQVNVDGDPSKAGFAPGDLATALEGMALLDGLDMRGLMTVGRLVPTAEAARPTFVALRELSARVRDRGLALGPDLSMGMTDDFEVAVEEGATIVRVGRAIFGERPHHHAPGEPEHTHAG
jgi:pyridoxal phosphate enzyme (YggS family)